MLVRKGIFVSGKLGWTRHLMDFAALMHPCGLNSSISWTFEFVYFEFVRLVDLFVFWDSSTFWVHPLCGLVPSVDLMIHSSTLWT